MSSTTGKLFVVSTFGESHGPAVGAVVDGCPAGLSLTVDDIQGQMDRRRPGQSSITTSRDEADAVSILSGVDDGITLGTPITLVVENRGQRPADYSETANIPRPSHADYTYMAKYGKAPESGGGRASARETVGRVAAGSVAEKYLSDRHGVEIVAWVSSVGTIDASSVEEGSISRSDVDVNPVRCPDADAASRMENAINSAASEGDSLGGIITCVCRNVPAGLGEPVFDKMEAALGSAMMSIPASKGFEIGSGFSAARMRGSEHNDMFKLKEGDSGVLGTVTNRSGGVQGGITNGESIVFRVAFKPVASIRVPQETVDYEGKPVVLEMSKGRHDPCVLPRAVPVVEAMAALVLADMMILAGK